MVDITVDLYATLHKSGIAAADTDPALVVIRGFPGQGKTSLAKDLGILFQDEVNGEQ